MDTDRNLVITRPDEEGFTLYATDEWRFGPLGWERQWTHDPEEAALFTEEAGERFLLREERRLPV